MNTTITGPNAPEDYCPNCLAWVLHVTDGICPWCARPLAKAIQPRTDRVVRINCARDERIDDIMAGVDRALASQGLARARALGEPTYDDMAPAKTPQLRHGWAEHVPSSESAPPGDWVPLAWCCAGWLVAVLILGAVLVLGHLGILSLAGVM